MVKRKSKAKSRTKNADASTIFPSVVPLSATELFEIGAWAGIPQYRCKLCKFDTLHKDAIEQHIKDTHLKLPGAAPLASTTTNNETDQVPPEGDLNGVFEIELEEVSNTIDEQGNEHKKFTIKEN